MEFLLLLVGRIVRSRLHILPQPPLQGFSHFVETLDETTVYVTRIEERMELSHFLWEPNEGDGGGLVLGDFNAMRKEHVVEVF